MKETFPENPEFFHKKRKFLAAAKSGREINTEELVNDDELMFDKETVLCMLQAQGGDLLKYVSADLRDDEQVVFQACSNEGVNPPMNDAWAFQHAFVITGQCSTAGTLGFLFSGEDKAKLCGRKEFFLCPSRFFQASSKRVAEPSPRFLPKVRRPFTPTVPLVISSIKFRSDESGRKRMWKISSSPNRFVLVSRRNETGEELSQAL